MHHADVDGAKQFRGDGYLVFTPETSKPIELPWSVSFVFRTRQSPALLIRIDMPPNHYVTVEVGSFIIL